LHNCKMEVPTASEPRVALPARVARDASVHNPEPQHAPGSSAAVGHILGNSIPLSIFPISDDKICFCFCGLPGEPPITHALLLYFILSVFLCLPQVGERLTSREDWPGEKVFLLVSASLIYLDRYLSFFHALPVQIFNGMSPPPLMSPLWRWVICSAVSVGEYRRRMCGALKDADWFNENNAEGVAWREKCNHAALSDMVEYLRNLSMGVAILDATNGTHEKRLRILQMVSHPSSPSPPSLAHLASRCEPRACQFTSSRSTTRIKHSSRSSTNSPPPPCPTTRAWLATKR
jgi:hypothetical protein